MIRRLSQCCTIHNCMRNQRDLNHLQLISRAHYLIMAPRKESKFTKSSRGVSGTPSTNFRTGASSQQSESEIKTHQQRFMIVGLGNSSFPDTRHSVGMRAADILVTQLGKTWDRNTKIHGGHFCEALLERNGTEAFLVMFKPKALMNVSGVSVAKAAKSFVIPPANIYLIHDELDKAVGKFHIKEGGSARGHNGVLSCMNCLRSDEMSRLRIGISRPSCKSQVVSYVLDKIPKEDLPAIDGAISDGLNCVLDHIVKRVDSSSKSKDSTKKESVRQKKRRTSQCLESDATSQEDVSVQNFTPVQSEPLKGQNSAQPKEDREGSPER